MEPTGQLVLAGTILQTGEAAIKLTDTLVGRMTARRMIANGEKEALAKWLRLELQKLDDLHAVILNESAQTSLVAIWETYFRAANRMPAAESQLAQLRDLHAGRLFQGRA